MTTTTILKFIKQKEFLFIVERLSQTIILVDQYYSLGIMIFEIIIVIHSFFLIKINQKPNKESNKILIYV